MSQKSSIEPVAMLKMLSKRFMELENGGRTHAHHFSAFIYGVIIIAVYRVIAETDVPGPM